MLACLVGAITAVSNNLEYMDIHKANALCGYTRRQARVEPPFFWIACRDLVRR